MCGWWGSWALSSSGPALGSTRGLRDTRPRFSTVSCRPAGRRGPSGGPLGTGRAGWGQGRSRRGALTGVTGVGGFPGPPHPIRGALSPEHLLIYHTLVQQQPLPAHVAGHVELRAGREETKAWSGVSLPREPGPPSMAAPVWGRHTAAGARAAWTGHTELAPGHHGRVGQTCGLSWSRALRHKLGRRCFIYFTHTRAHAHTHTLVHADERGSVAPGCRVRSLQRCRPVHLSRTYRERAEAPLWRMTRYTPVLWVPRGARPGPVPPPLSVYPPANRESAAYVLGQWGRGRCPGQCPGGR